ncbi:MaoC family dehydratase N-terminal domain-containing protein [Halorussus limi]|uniref:MaoC family dehydratase N-terminal domain-containing protein n=1 Tax=Halorussus limi TaxID=2938695 RepID=A0A8U0HS99_9EURY|nr:MaoC/PaaZ C-terminal domain-containing protein [Halorussus limi]UPV73739.1 MaoC family dehydratase N-terminal domain-containing protein [Halorussus limi]
MSPPEEGDTRTFQRTFTPEDVRQFADVSGDEQPRHLEPDDDGRLLVHGLLTATMPTKIGADLEVLGRSMTFDFRKPVYTGETLTCEMTVEAVDEQTDRYDLSAAVTCENEDGETVLTGTVEGLVWK